MSTNSWRGSHRTSAKSSRKRAKPPQAAPAPDEPWVEEAERAPGLSPYELDRLEREITVEQRRARRPLEPEFLPPPPPRLRAQKAAGDSFTGLILRLVAVAVVAALLALIFVGKLSLPARWKGVRDRALEAGGGARNRHGRAFGRRQRRPRFGHAEARRRRRRRRDPATKSGLA